MGILISKENEMSALDIEINNAAKKNILFIIISSS